MLNGGEPGQAGFVSARVANMWRPSFFRTHYERATCKPTDPKTKESVKEFAVVVEHQEIATARSIECETIAALKQLEGSSVGACREIHFLRFTRNADAAIKMIKIRR